MLRAVGDTVGAGCGGKPDDMLVPLITICPAPLTATLCAPLDAAPPRISENTSWPFGSSFATKDRSPVSPVGAAPKLPPLVTGKSGDPVVPAT